MRIFFGVRLSQPETEQLASLQARIPEQLEGARPRLVPPANFHLTLAFLGNLDPSRLDGLQQCGDRVQTQCSPGLAAMGRISGFPHPGSRLIALTGTPDAALDHLYEHLLESLAANSYLAERRPFLPHITLARLTYSAIPNPSWPLSLDLPVVSFALFQSVSNTRGVQYRVLKEWTLS